MTNETADVTKELVEGLIGALSDKHSQMDLRLNALTLSLGGSRLGLQLSGSVSVAIHMRDLTDGEKEAHVASNIARIQA
jgi:hypothetical protein